MAKKNTLNEAVRPAKTRKPDEWEVRNALDTLSRAEAIKKDTKMMKAVKVEAQKLQKIVGVTTGKPTIKKQVKKGK